MALERERKIDIYIESGGYKKRQTYKKEMDRQRDSRTCVAKRSHQAKISPRPYNRYTLTYTYIPTYLPQKGGRWSGMGLEGAWHGRWTVARRTSKLSKTATMAAADPKRQKMLPQLSKWNFCEIERGGIYIM